MAYGEWLPKISPSEIQYEKGDVISYQNINDTAGYIKAQKSDKFIIGVVDDASIISGHVPDAIFYDTAGNEIEFETEEESIRYGFIPTAINGIVNVKFTGQSKIGGYVTMSDIQGVAKLKESNEEIEFGKILNDGYSGNDINEVRLIQIILLDNTIANENKKIKDQVTEINDTLLEVMFGSEESFNE